MNDGWQEVLEFIVLMIALPYVVGPPLALIWFGLAVLVWKITGWKGLLPANAWSAVK